MKQYSLAFTLVELLIFIAVVGGIGAYVLLKYNPVTQFAERHNAQRTSDVEKILNAVERNVLAHGGAFRCGGKIVFLPPGGSDIATHGADLRPCLVPDYMTTIGYDPNGGNNYCIDTPGTTDCASGSYDTKYVIATTSENHYVVSAPNAELGKTISLIH